MSDETVIERAEMGITQADFLRIFPRLVTTATSADIGMLSHIQWPAGMSLKVKVSQEFIRKIAAMRIPYVNIRFEFQGFTATARTDFMAHFDRAFHKGGG